MSGVHYKKDGVAYKVHQSRRWRVLSRVIRQRQPICPDPYALHAGRYLPTEHTHHIDAIEDAPSLAYTEGNLIALCAVCHAHVELLYGRGVDTRDHLRVVRKRIRLAGDLGTTIGCPDEATKANQTPLGGIKCLDLPALPTAGPSSSLFPKVEGGVPLCIRLSSVQVYCCRMRCHRVTKCGSCKHL